MKKRYNVILFIFIFSIVVSSAFFGYTSLDDLYINANAAENNTVVYVMDGGSGSLDGSSPNNAISDMKSAVNAIGSNNGTVVMCGPTSVSGDHYEPAHTGNITITSYYNGVDYRKTNDAVFNLDNKYIIGGPVCFENITVYTAGTLQFFFGNGYPLEFGEGVECTLADPTGTYPYIYGANNKKTGTLSGASVTISSGHFSKVSGGYRYVGGTIAGDVSVTVNGGTVDTYLNGSGVSKVNGNVSVTVNGGKIGYGVYGMDSMTDRATTVEGNVTLNINGGDLAGTLAAAKLDKCATLNGTYTCAINTDSLDKVVEIRSASNIEGTNTSKIAYGDNIDPTKAPNSTVSYQNPITTGADPWIIYRDGYYYMAVVRGASITIAKSLTVAGLGRAEPVVVWTATTSTGVDDSIWSPELHYFSSDDFSEEYAGWYLYFACPPTDHAGDNFYRRSYALRALTDDPQGAWGSPDDKTPNVPKQIAIDEDNSNWNIGPSIFRIDSKIYMTWTGRKFEYYGEHTQNLNIAKMTTPYSIDISTKAIICEPTESWEKQGATYSSSTEKNLPEVVEGATAVYGDNGEVWCIYSASGYWTDSYALAQLRFTGGDPCNASNWEKCSSPIFKQNTEVYGPGHASYTKGLDGTRYFIYHGYLEPSSVSNRSRYIFIEEYSVSGNNVVLGNGTPKALSSTISVANTILSIKNRTSGFENIIYVSSTGNDANDGSSAAAAVATLDRAFALIPSGGKIVFVGTSYTIDKNYSTPASDGEYTLTSALMDSSGNAGIVNYSGTLELNSDFIIESIRFKGSSTPIIVCNGHNVTFGKNITNDTNSYIVGGANLLGTDTADKGNLTKDYTITVESGSWVSLFGGNRRTTGTSPVSTISGDINIVIDGATFKNSTISASSNQNSISGMNSTTGNLNLTVKSGEFYTGIFAIGRLGTSEQTPEYKGSINIKLLGGKFNVTGTNAQKAGFGVFQESNRQFDGDCYIEISETATIGYVSIEGTGVTGSATLNAPSALSAKATGFDKIMTCPYPLGDVDADGNIANTDITLLIRVLAGWSETYSQQNADLDANDKITNKDAILLIQKLCGWY